jgi:ferredoxin-NADP reductase
MRTYNVKSTQQIAPNTVLLSLQPKRSADSLRFWPGQYAAIGFRRGGRPSPVRCFSIASSPTNSDELQFGMRVYGDFTCALSNLERGDEVFVHGPFGNFVIDEQLDKSVILMAGGIGITPFMSMIRYVTETRSNVSITLLYSCRLQDDIPFYQELLDLQRRNPRFKAVFFVTGGGVNKLTGSRTVAGRINEDHLNQLTSGQYNRFTHFICGPKNFNRGMKAILAANGTDPERIVTEEFTPSSQADSVAPEPKYNISRWTYALTGASLVLGTIFFMGLDLVRAVPKLVNAQAAAPTTAQNQSTNTNQTVPSTTSSNSSPSSNSNSTTTTQPSYSQPTQTYYQAPVTSIS